MKKTMLIALHYRMYMFSKSINGQQLLICLLRSSHYSLAPVSKQCLKAPEKSVFNGAFYLGACGSCLAVALLLNDKAAII